MIPLLLLLQVAPDGWRVELLARVKNPTAVAAAPSGHVYVGQDPMDMEGPVDARRGRVLRVCPDGRVNVFAEGLGPVFGLAWHADRLYVHDCLRLAAYRDVDGRGADLVEILPATHPHPSSGNNYNTHIPAGFRLAPDGFFYMAVGDKGIPGIPRPDGGVFRMRGGGVIRFRPDGSGLEIVATGTRNILDVAVTPAGDLFAFDNDDNAAWGARVLHVSPGDDFGYPWSRGKPWVRPAVHESRGIPAGCVAFGDDILLCDWGRSRVTRYRFAVEDAGVRVAERQPLIVRGDEEFRPVGIDVQGASVYVSDWNTAARRVASEAGRLFRFTAPNAPTSSRARAAPPKPLPPKPTPILVDAPWDGGWWGSRPALNPEPLPTREHAETERIRADLRRRLDAEDPSVRRAAIEGLLPDRASAGALRGRLEREPIPDVRRAIFAALIRQEDPGLEALAARYVKSFDPDLFEAAAGILRSRDVAREALLQARAPEHIVKLLPLAPSKDFLRHPHAAVRAAALRHVDDREAVPDLLALGAEALPALLRMPDPRAESHYREALKKDPETRIAARRALLAIGSDPGIGSAPPADPGGGDASRGRSLFHGGLGCSRCHAVGSEGGDIGPELTMIGAVYGRPLLAEHILFPDRIIHGAYRSTRLRLRSGDVVSGLLRRESAEELLLLDVEGRLRRVAKADVDARRVAESSIMPAGLVDGLPAADFADLLSYLESLKGEE